jgi:PKHD-type hydroxylase
MILNNYYYYFKSALSSKFCDDIIAYGKQKKDQIGVTHSIKKRDFKKSPITKKEILDLKKTRDSNIVWMDDKWIYDQIHPYINEANKAAGWNFDWDYSESCQFTKYKLNQFYNWHCDSFNQPYQNPGNLNVHGKIRKLSVTCSLSDPSDYKGGELEFNYNNPERTKKQNIVKCKEILTRGSIVVFPSHIYHRVNPVTKGTRYSLVVWNLGYPFK